MIQKNPPKHDVGQNRKLRHDHVLCHAIMAVYTWASERTVCYRLFVFAQTQNDVITKCAKHVDQFFVVCYAQR